MTRWQPDARDRLIAAAYELYEQRGYERTTVAEIAQAAGLSERTFFRHFADKREVLFSGSADLLDGMVTAALAAPDGATPLDVVTVALEAVAVFLQPRHPHSARRRALIVGTAELQERELAKMATLTAAMAEALGRRAAGRHRPRHRRTAVRRRRARLPGRAARRHRVSGAHSSNPPPTVSATALRRARVMSATVA